MARPLKSVPLTPFQQRHAAFLESIKGPGFPRSRLILQASVSALLSQIERHSPGLMRPSRMMLKIVRAHEDRICSVLSNPTLDSKGKKLKLDPRIVEALAYKDIRVQDALKFMAYGDMLRGNHVRDSICTQRQLLVEFLDANEIQMGGRSQTIIKERLREWFKEHGGAVHKKLIVYPCLCNYPKEIEIEKATEVARKAHLIEEILASLHVTTRSQIHKIIKPIRPPTI